MTTFTRGDITSYNMVEYASLHMQSKPGDYLYLVSDLNRKEHVVSRAKDVKAYNIMNIVMTYKDFLENYDTLKSKKLFVEDYLCFSERMLQFFTGCTTEYCSM